MNVEIVGLRPRSFFSGNTLIEFSLQCGQLKDTYKKDAAE
jgi:hypothetical protein